ncbi:MAG: mechanosensitive ion channel family protein [Candidatus Acidiferrales bacterium]
MQNFFERTFLEPFNRLAEQFAAVMAPLIVVVVILIIGGALAYIVRVLVYKLLVAAKFDRTVDSTGTAGTLAGTAVFRSPSDFAARMVQSFVWLLVILMALYAGGQMTKALVERFISYIPDIITAALVLLLGAAISRFLARAALLAAVNAQWGAARLIAGGVRVLVMFLAVVIALEQLRIGQTALQISFAILFGGLVLAGALAFGLGARDFVREWLRDKAAKPKGEEEDVFRHL